MTLPLVSICVCTFKRPQLLVGLLHSLGQQQLAGARIEVIVVDNDPAATAKAAVEQFACSHPAMAVRYDVEPRSGISYARNRTVELAQGTLLAFVDDDEIAATDWLQSLLETLSGVQADAAFGPVIPVFEPGSKQWAMKGGFFERPRLPQGQFIKAREARTGNALLHARWARERQPVPFSEELALSGGEDVEFFTWMESQEAKLVWSDNAIVSEVVPIERQRIAWLLERRLRASVTNWRGHYTKQPMLRNLAHAGVGGTASLVALLAGIAAFPFSRVLALKCWVKTMTWGGRIGALLGIKLRGYGSAAP